MASLPVAAPAASSAAAVSSAPLSLDDASVIARFQSLLRLRTIANEGPSNGANDSAVQYLKSLGESMGLSSQILTYAPGRPILVLTLPGTDASLTSLLLNSHYDVVPVMREKWSVDPFVAEVNSEGKILARGTQDMKCVCMSYLEALLRLLRGGENAQPVKAFARTVHLSFMPDEETGGEWGMQKWVESAEFKALNVGFALDEGIANPKDEFTVFYGERGVWWMSVKAQGPTGHASRFIKDPATQKLMRAVQHFLAYRDLQESKLLNSQAHTPGECGHAVSKKLELGDVITINLTVLKAGVTVDNGKTYSYNVVPMEAEAGFDLRLPPHVDLVEFENLVKEWTAEEGLSYSVRKFSAEYVTNLSEEKNPFWVAFQSALGRVCGSTKVVPQIFPAGTDSRFLRKALIPVIGFSPLSETPVLLHDHDEFISTKTFLRGIRVYEELIPSLANLTTVMPNSDGVYLQPKQPMDKLLGAAATAASVHVGSGQGSSSTAQQTDTPQPAASPIPTQTEGASSASSSTQTAARRPSVTTETQTEATSAAAATNTRSA